MNEKTRGYLDDYLRKNPRMGDAWLFPAPKDDSMRIRKNLAGEWLVRAEKLAKLPKMKGGRWNPYRRLWATERMHLPAKAVAAAGGWGDTQALEELYQHVGGKSVYEAVEGA